jgi:hypothetical protein
MAAGQGFKTFTTGEVLTASDTNGYLMQGVNVFADAAARTAAITSPQEGQMSFLKDTNSTEYYSGSAWVAVAGATSATYVGAAAFRSTNLSVAKNTNVLLTLPSEQYDTNAFHSTVTNTGRFTIPSGKAGKYLLTCSVSWSSAITEQAWLMLYVNGAATTLAVAGLPSGQFQQFPGTANTDFIAGSVSYTYNVGDYAEVYVFHNGTATTLDVDGARVTFDYLGA